MERAARRIFQLVACAIALGLAAAAMHDVSKAWDVWAYHLPFAARIAGIVGPDAYAFSAENAARFAGFPLLAEALQGTLWAITRRPEHANLVALFSLFALVAFLRRVLRVPMHASLLAFIAIPLVMIHATASYVDLTANALATMLLAWTLRTVLRQALVRIRDLAIGAALAAGVVNTKFQLVPLVVAASIVLVVRSLRPRAGRWKRLLFCVLVLPIVLATPLKNTIVHGNPVYPVEVTVLGKTLPAATTAYVSSPRYLENASRPRRFVWSALEVGVRRWSVDQWTPPDDPGYRMGGFFGAYVVVNVVALAWALWRKRSREAFVACAFVAGVTLVVAFAPQSHELRYYMVWMLFLVSVNLLLWARDAPVATPFVAACALAFVTWATRGAYLYPSGDSFATLLDARVEKRVVEGAAPGTTICVAREPWTFLYAPTFHGKAYRVQEATTPEECMRYDGGR